VTNRLPSHFESEISLDVYLCTFAVNTCPMLHVDTTEEILDTGFSSSVSSGTLYSISIDRHLSRYSSRWTNVLSQRSNLRRSSNVTAGSVGSF